MPVRFDFYGDESRNEAVPTKKGSYEVQGFDGLAERQLLAQAFEVRGNGSRASHCAPKKLVTDETIGRDEADPQRAYVRFVCDLLHLATNKIVGQQDAPQFLDHPLRGLTSHRTLRSSMSVLSSSKPPWCNGCSTLEA